jgi:hypothetical protein
MSRSGGRHVGGLAALALAATLLGGCTDRYTWRAGEAHELGWWIEDLAHGSPRRQAELDVVDGSEMEARVAQWARGNEIHGESTWPDLLQARCSRHGLLATLAGQGFLVHTRDGLLAPRPGLRIDQRVVVEPAVDAEDRDRRQLDATVLALADARPEVADAYLAAVRAARAELDEAMGVKAWTGTVRAVPGNAGSP